MFQQLTNLDIVFLSLFQQALFRLSKGDSICKRPVVKPYTFFIITKCKKQCKIIYFKFTFPQQKGKPANLQCTLEDARHTPRMAVVNYHNQGSNSFQIQNYDSYLQFRLVPSKSLLELVYSQIIALYVTLYNSVSERTEYQIPWNYLLVNPWATSA